MRARLIERWGWVGGAALWFTAVGVAACLAAGESLAVGATWREFARRLWGGLCLGASEVLFPLAVVWHVVRIEWARRSSMLSYGRAIRGNHDRRVTKK